MALLQTITPEQFNALDIGVKGAYRTNAAGGYDLDLAPNVFVIDQDPAALLNSKNYVVAENNTLKANVAAAEAAKLEAENMAAQAKAQKSGDFESYKKQVELQMAQQKAEFDTANQQRDDLLMRQTLDSHANRIAQEVAGENGRFAAPIIRNQLRVEMQNGAPVVQVLDTMGNVAIGKTVDSLKQEFLDNPQNKAIIIQSKASGGSTPGTHSGSTVLTPDKKFSDYSPADLSKLNKESPEEYQKLRDARDTEIRKTGAVPLGSRPR